MKNSYILVLMCIILSINTQVKAQEASYKILYDVSGSKINRVSNNGEWIGYGSGGVAYYYNTITEKSKTITDSEHPGMSIQAISNSGMLAGAYGFDTMSPAAYFKNNKWTILPTPKGREKDLGMVSSISDDETIMGGYIDGNRGAKEREQLLPCIWKLTNGEYQLEVLPQPLKDITGVIAQGSAVRSMSGDGSVLAGNLWGGDGFINLPIIWIKGKDGKYTYKVWGEELVYNLDAENPGPFPLYEDYVTAPEGTPEYEKQYAMWNKLATDFIKKRGLFYKGKGTFELRNIAVSNNGRWVVIAWQEWDSPKGLQAYKIDLQNNTAIVYDGDYNTCPRGVLDDGTVFAFSPFNGDIWTGLVYKNENEGQIPLYKWIDEETGIDISSDFLFNISVTDPETGKINQVDSIVTGVCTISKDGSTIVSYLYDPDNYYRIINFYVRKQPTNNIDNQLIQNTSAYIRENILYIKGDINELIITDLTGKNILHTRTIENTLSLNFLPKGIYLVQLLTISGETVTNKVIIE